MKRMHHGSIGRIEITPEPGLNELANLSKEKKVYVDGRPAQRALSWEDQGVELSTIEKSSELSPFEKLVASYVLEALSNSKIADRLQETGRGTFSNEAIGHHVRKIKEKLGLG